MELKDLISSYQLGKITTYEKEVGSHWISQISSLHEELSREMESQGKESKSVDPILSSLVSLMDLAIECSQFQRSFSQFEDVTRVLKVRVKMSRKEIERYLDAKPVSVYGVGLYFPVEGLLLDSKFREDSRYDESLLGRKGVKFDISSIPESIRRTHEFRLAVPAMNGLFVPRKSKLMNEVRSSKSLQFFDISLL